MLFLLGHLSLMIVCQTYAADGVVKLAEREAAIRQTQVAKAGSELNRASDLVLAGKTSEAFEVLESVYAALPEAALTEEIRSVTKAGLISVGCMWIEELLAGGKRPQAEILLDKLLKLSSSDQRLTALRSRLLDPDRYPPALTEQHIEKVHSVQALLLKGNSAIELGDYELAKRCYEDVIRIDPSNGSARRGMERAEREKARYYDAAQDHQRSRMLNAVTQAWEDPVPPSAAELGALFGARAQASSAVAAGRDSILDQLRNYRLPKVEFLQVTIMDVLELLRIRSRDLDPKGKGVDFVPNIPDESRQRQISLTLSDVPMEEVLRYACEAAGVTYRVEQHAVMITSQSEKNAAMVTRSFRVPPDFIQNTPAAAPPAAGADPFAQPVAGAAGGGLTLRRMGAKAFLESRGVLFPEGASASFSGSTSTLVVHNTAANMELIENLVELASNSSPKMVVVSVRMLEVNQKNLDELGFDWLMGGVGFNGNNVFAGGGSAGSGAAYNPANYPFGGNAVIPAITVGGQQVYPAQNVSSAIGGHVPVGVNNINGGGGGPITAGNRSGTFAAGVKSLDSLLQTGGTSQSVGAPGVLSIAGVFTDPQFQTVMRGLAQKKGVDIAASPSVTTKSGVKATVELTREFIYPTEFDPPQLPQGQGGGGGGGGGGGALIATPTTPTAFETRRTGVLMEVEPVVSDDGRSVEVVLAPEVVDFEGFINYGSPIFSPSSSAFQQVVTPVINLVTTAGGVTTTQSISASTAYVPLIQPEQLITPNKILQPVFKSSKVSTSVKVWDGQTIVLGGLKQQEHNIIDDMVPILGNLPYVGRLFRSHVKQAETKNVIFFVTVDVIDPSGQKIRNTVQTAASAP